MPVEERGVKRVCIECGVRFYDLNREPITCPGCGGTFDLDALLGRNKPDPRDMEVSTPEGDPLVDSIETEEADGNIDLGDDVLEDDEDTVDIDSIKDVASDDE